MRRDYPFLTARSRHRDLAGDLLRARAVVLIVDGLGSLPPDRRRRLVHRLTEERSDLRVVLCDDAEVAQAPADAVVVRLHPGRPPATVDGILARAYPDEAERLHAQRWLGWVARRMDGDRDLSGGTSRPGCRRAGSVPPERC